MCSTITVVNPITDQRIMAPHSSISWDYRWCLVSRKLHRFSFGYHPTTGKYKVVDVTCSSSSSSSYKTGRLAIDWVQVFTFTMSKMESSWREVLDIPDWGFQDSGGVVTVDGATHWLAARGERVVALDLEDDGRDPEEATCRLNNVHERLGVLVTCRHSPAMRVDLWVLEELEDEGGHRRRPARWSRKCSLMEPTSPDDERWITSPHFTHGEYVLSKRNTELGYKEVK
nr:unnamed protein product [Digitaria exilis]